MPLLLRRKEPRQRMAGQLMDSTLDSTGNEVRPGELVTYHGSVPEAHGTWTYAGGCCSACSGTNADGTLMERGVTLMRQEGGGTRFARHVHPGSITLATA